GLKVGFIRRIQGLDTAYWGFFGVGTTLDIFQNIHILYLQYGVLTSSGYGVLILFLRGLCSYENFHQIKDSTNMVIGLGFHLMRNFGGHILKWDYVVQFLIGKRKEVAAGIAPRGSFGVQFSLVDNSKLNDVDILLGRLKQNVSLLEGLQGGKKFHVKRNKAISLGMNTSKVGIEVQ
ncbi:hypothetical protein Tco_0429675, partial [Tanacetum coccineum]